MSNSQGAASLDEELMNSLDAAGSAFDAASPVAAAPTILLILDHLRERQEHDQETHRQWCRSQ